MWTRGIAIAFVAYFGFVVVVAFFSRVLPEPRSFFLLLHTLSFVLAFGTVLLTDGLTVSLLRSGIVEQSHIEFMRSGSRAIILGLGLLWFSGIGLVLIQYVNDPSKLINPKLAAKIIIVVALTLNGVLIHKIAMPAMVKRIGKTFIDGVTQEGLLAIGAVSTVSWSWAFMLGQVREFNLRFSVWELLGSYIVTVLGAFLILEYLCSWIIKKKKA